MSAATGTDWTRILSDPDLVRHVGKLLQAYREAPVEKREETLAVERRPGASSLERARTAGAKEWQSHFERRGADARCGFFTTHRAERRAGRFDGGPVEQASPATTRRPRLVE